MEQALLREFLEHTSRELEEIYGAARRGALPAEEDAVAYVFRARPW